jgi:Fe-S cluster assembly protein SufD
VTSHVSRLRTEAETALDLQFAALEAKGARADAFAVFAQRGLPSRRDEAWHYTDLRAALKHAAPLAAAPDAARLQAAEAALAALPRIGATRLVLVDGHYAPSLSDPAPAGVTFVLAEAGGETGDALLALNTAFAPAALGVEIAADAGPVSLDIVHLDGPGAIYSRVSLSAPDEAEVSVFERFDGGTSDTQRNAVTLIDLGTGAVCDWTTLAADAAALHLEAPVARLAGGARFTNFALVCGPALARRQIDVSHSGPAAKIALNGLSLIDGSRHADTTLTVRHSAPQGESREFFRHIVADAGVGVYQGKVIVDQYAQKTDGGMKSQALLLSPTAQMNNKPELEIFADDVVCGHGATVAQLDPEQIFYLQARGVAKVDAEAMLLEAFGIEAIERVADEGARDLLNERLRDWLNRRAA